MYSRRAGILEVDLGDDEDARSRLAFEEESSAFGLSDGRAVQLMQLMENDQHVVCLFNVRKQGMYVASQHPQDCDEDVRRKRMATRRVAPIICGHCLPRAPTSAGASSSAMPGVYPFSEGTGTARPP